MSVFVLQICDLSGGRCGKNFPKILNLGAAIENLKSYVPADRNVVSFKKRFRSGRSAGVTKSCTACVIYVV